MWKNDGLFILITAVNKTIDFAQNFISFAVQIHQNFIVEITPWRNMRCKCIERDLLRRRAEQVQNPKSYYGGGNVEN